MADFDYDFFNEEEVDEEQMASIKKTTKERRKNFTSVINKKKLSKYELDDLMSV